MVTDSIPLYFQSAADIAHLPVFGMCWALLGVDIILRLVLVEKRVAIKWQPDPDSQQDNPTHGSASHAHTENDVESHRSNEMTDRGQSLVVTGAKNSRFAGRDGNAQTFSPLGDSTQQPSPAPLSDESSIQHRNPAHVATRPNRIPAIFHLLKSPRLLAALWAGIVQSTLLTALDVSSRILSACLSSCSSLIILKFNVSYSQRSHLSPPIPSTGAPWAPV